MTSRKLIFKKGEVKGMEKLLCPSMMCADFGNLAHEVNVLNESQIDIFHLDVMDGNFVPNFGMGLQDIEFICKNTNKPCDVHLMVSNPSMYIHKFANLGVKIIYVHPETDLNITRTLQDIRNENVSAGIAVSPGVSFETVQYLLTLCDYVLIMTVNPGFSGQSYLDYVTPKIKKFVDESKNYGNYKVMIDGACSPERITELSKIGVNGFILGTSAMFGKDKDYIEISKELKNN